MFIRNKSSETRFVPVEGEELEVPPGETVEVPDDLANGTKGDGEPTLEDGTPNPEFRPGTSGLLAQSDVWEKSSAKKANTSAPADGEEG